MAVSRETGISAPQPIDSASPLLQDASPIMQDIAQPLQDRTVLLDRLASVQEALPYDPALHREIIKSGVTTELYEAFLPLGSVLTENALVDEAHARDLAKNIKSSPRGQINNIAVRARIDEETDEIVYDVIDGYHRSAGRKAQGAETIQAKVLFGCDDEELSDQRILASTVRAVQYPRIAEWITNSWATTEWAAAGLTVAQGFGIAMNNSTKTYNADLSPEQIDAMKAWCKEKCQKWNKPISSTYQVLRIVGDADPELVSQVRQSGGGKDHTGRITPSRLAAVVSAYPGVDNYAIQRAILDHVVDKRMSADETKAFVEKARAYITTELDAEQLAETLEFVRDLKLTDTVFDSNGHTDEVIVMEDEKNNSFAGLDEDEDEEFEYDEDAQEPSLADLVAIEEGEEVHDLPYEPVTTSGKTKTPSLFAGVSGQSTGSYFDTPYDEINSLKARVRDLQDVVATVQAENTTGRDPDNWAARAGYLSPEERSIYTRFVLNGENMTIIAENLGITDKRAWLLLQSANSKRSNNEHIEKNREVDALSFDEEL